MPLQSIDLMMKNALAGRYAVGYFESWNLESLHGVVDAAEESRSPIIIGFGGNVVSSAGRLAWYAAVGRAAAESASVPCGLILNECSDVALVSEAVAAGFNLVMPTSEEGVTPGFIAALADLVRHAHRHHAAVEAEIDELPWGSSDAAGTGLTDPRRAAEFVAQTGVDLLSVNVGNVHAAESGGGAVAVDHVAAIRKQVKVPLVLHGGSGVSPAALRAAVAAGIAKVNFGTNMKRAYLAALRQGLNASRQDPHELLGRGGDDDIMMAGRRAVRDVALQCLPPLGCCGKA